MASTKSALNRPKTTEIPGPLVKLVSAVLGSFLLAGCVPKNGVMITSESGKRKPEAITRPQSPMSLDDARGYLLRLINRDREAEGLEPVARDAAAEKAGQEHAVDMATHGYTAHIGTDGSVPELRYTNAGGTGMVQENVACIVDGKDRKLDANGPFSAENLESIEALFIGEKPPNDGHRRNILTPWHTHVGIGIAKPAGVPLLCVAQEFVDHYGDYTPLPVSARLGKSIRVAGNITPPAVFAGIGLARIDTPQAQNAAQLNQTHSYPVPAPYVTYFPEGFVTPIPVKVNGKHFAIDVPLNDQRRPGIYEVSVWARVPETSKLIMVSLRTISVK